MMVNSFGHVCGGQRMLRGEQLFRSNKVHSLTTTAHDGVVFKANVFSQDYRSGAAGGAYSTRIRFEPLSDDEIRYAGAVLRKQDAWTQLQRQRQLGLNVLQQAGKGAELAEALIKSLDSLPILPHTCTHVASATCSCSDFAPDKWCKHVAAVGYQLVAFCEADPFYPFYLRRMDIAQLPGSVMPPRKRARKHSLPDSTDEVLELSDSEDVGSSAKHAGTSRKHAIECE